MSSHDERLIAQVHPPAWKNPVPRERYHLVVIGAGTAGLVSAAGAAGLGARVALVERQPDDFRLVWDWTRLRSFLARSEIETIKARRKTLLGLLDAVAREDRKAILEGLKAIQSEFPAQADGPEKAPREPCNPPPQSVSHLEVNRTRD